MTGFYPLLTNGINVWNLYYSDFAMASGDLSIHFAVPRLALGVSQNKRYLYLMTIDGWQPGYSDGALDADTGMWMLLFGAWDAVNMDGGGSTAMYMADCGGNPVALNHSSYLAGRGYERIIGDCFGVYADPLPILINNMMAVPGMTTANITWTTTAPSSSQVEYGLNKNYGSISANDPTPVTSHTVTLTGLKPATRYFYRVLSSDGTTTHSAACAPPFVTTNNQAVGMIYGLTQDWKYTTDNLDAVDWRATGYDDAGWNDGAGVLWVDPDNPGGNPAIQFLPLNTEMPDDPSTTYLFLLTISGLILISRTAWQA